MPKSERSNNAAGNLLTGFRLLNATPFAVLTSERVGWNGKATRSARNAVDEFQRCATKHTSIIVAPWHRRRRWKTHFGTESRGLDRYVTRSLLFSFDIRCLRGNERAQKQRKPLHECRHFYSLHIHVHSPLLVLIYQWHW